MQDPKICTESKYHGDPFQENSLNWIDVCSEYIMYLMDPFQTYALKGEEPFFAHAQT